MDKAKHERLDRIKTRLREDWYGKHGSDVAHLVRQYEYLLRVLAVHRQDFACIASLAKKRA